MHASVTLFHHRRRLRRRCACRCHASPQATSSKALAGHGGQGHDGVARQAGGIGRIDPDKLVEVERCLAVLPGIAK